MASAPIPQFIYGTAWKEDRTADLTYDALKCGFTAIDTANQRKHYFEEGVGQGIQKFLKETGKLRKDLFIQSKFTFARGQDHRKPYNETDSFTKQVQDSFQSSLQHLDTSYLDSYVLHGPYGNEGITEIDLETWKAMEQLHHQKQTHFLGVSNISATQLQELCGKVSVKPKFVQNRCYANKYWDKEVREICHKENIRYQGFSLLTANRQELTSEAVLEIARSYGKSIPQVVFRFAHQLEMIPLTGTSNVDHMSADLDIFDFELKAYEINTIENLSF